MVQRWSEQDIPDLGGKVAVVTGANAGLGFETAAALARRGASVVLACRNLDKAAAAAERIAAEGGVADVVALDLASLASVARAADELVGRHDRLDLLVNNAGLMAVDESRTEDGFEVQIGVNHLGHFALTARLLARLLATPGSRVVNVSSMGHRFGRVVVDDLHFERRGYARWPAYSQSKLANLQFTLSFDRRLREAGATTAALAAHPGGSHTDLGTEGTSIGNRVLPLAARFGQPAHAGALPILRAATDPAAQGGQFYGPRLLLRGHPVLETPSRRARDLAAAEALWRASEEATGIAFTVPAAPSSAQQ